MGVMQNMFRQVQELAKEMSVVETSLALSHISPTPQPRKRFERLDELAASIRERGVLQPLLVRKVGETYTIVAGERRYRAAQMAGLNEVPVVILEVDEPTAQQIALVENLQREDLNPYEETLGILALLQMRLGKDREEVVSLLQRMLNEAKGRVTHNVMGNLEAQTVKTAFHSLGRMTWESFTQNRLPLLRLPEDVKEALEDGVIPYTAALELKKLEDVIERKKLLDEVCQGLSLRDLKTKVQSLRRRQPAAVLWQKQVAKRIAQIDLEALPEDKRARVEGMLKELEDLLSQ